jgi:DNA integrity scanning protein DisA with diadenylate cyclase activity
MAPYLRQLILNPFAGHPREARSIHNPDMIETLRELATMDGAFVVGTDGTLESAGTCIVAGACRAELHPGLGARHAAAAAITAVTSATALVVSESSGTVTVFHHGRALLELERI